MSDPDERCADLQRRSLDFASDLAKPNMNRTSNRRTMDSTHQLSRKGGVGIAGRQRIRIKGKLREELDYSTLSYILHVMAKRRVDARRRIEAEERARTQGEKGERS